MMYHFIVNPSSQSGKSKALWKLIEKELKEHHIEYKLHLTQFEFHATKIVQEICQEKGQKIIVTLGGDGTVNEVINGITDFDNVTFSYIPTGSSNDFARGLGLPTKFKKALECVLYPKRTLEIDVGVVDFGEDETYKFGVSCGIGFDAAVCHEAYSSPIKDFLNKFHMGFLTYTIIAFKNMLTFKCAKVTVTFDDKDTRIFNQCLFVASMNDPCEGGGLRLAPNATPFDDHLDVFVINTNNKIKILTFFPLAFVGIQSLLDRFKEVSIIRCQKLHIKSDRPLPVHRDGEPCKFRTEMTVSLQKKKLKVCSL
ncbi:hypothetical protein TVAG_429710 [Trichomonas vaginalis G3]|uniref:DAGKc domain-containing protein n=1 Tax=Trichomonas vaginalis (strain ATCC PRA-98 / G3) TaxID=412133 RepID=A2FKN1_TRIV3|nr:D-erythro-sphingosine kinase protein [Trichomonas vaginalis G3]EAX94529.1 hypothetical protein TVAG_429710 [Trichomonas vaginalis G3]KAI5534845.1 D-erythro-sphingosine kinase protein [Trichomonas vaginalis G3]|eukprot:XP_001307459.1 hypothetical protein [Trichomonas vaginalis G3]